MATQPKGGKSAGSPAKTGAQKRPTGKQAKKPAKPSGGGVRVATASTQKRQRRDVAASTAEHQGPTMVGNYLLTPQGKKTMDLVYTKFTEGPLTFRALPTFDIDVWNESIDETGQAVKKFAPYRTGPEPDQRSDFFRTYPAVFYLGSGDNTSTFILYDPAGPDAEFAAMENPYLILHGAVRKAVYKDQTHTYWLPLIDRKSGGKDTLLQKPSTLYFFQGIVFAAGKRDYLKQGETPLGLHKKHRLPLIVLKNSAGSAVTQMLDKLQPGVDPMENDWTKVLAHGDVVGLDSGAFITVYNPDKDLALVDPQFTESSAVAAETEQGFGVSDDSETVGSAGGGSDDFKGYAARIDKHMVYRGRQTKRHARFDTEQLERHLLSKAQWFDDIIRVPSFEEQSLMIAKAMSGYRQVLEYAWRDYPQYLGEEVMKVLANATQVRVPGTPGTGVPGAVAADVAETSAAFGDEDGFGVFGEEDEESYGGAESDDSQVDEASEASEASEAGEDAVDDGYDSEEYDSEDYASAEVAEDEGEYDAEDVGEGEYDAEDVGEGGDADEENYFAVADESLDLSQEEDASEDDESEVGQVSDEEEDEAIQALKAAETKTRRRTEAAKSSGKPAAKTAGKPAGKRKSRKAT